MRYGIKPAPDGCGHPEDDPCFGCIVRHTRRSVRQLLPLKYTSVSHNVDKTYVSFDVWRMFLGRVFAHRSEHYRITA
jgi:hypothetical protein